MIMSFGGYSFCKPHSASYARVSFQAAYLKIHFPAEFMAAVISNRGGFYSTFAYVSEARRMGLDILPPDIDKSEMTWQGKDRAIRVGLISIKGLSERCRAAIVRERQKAPFQSMVDVLTRIRPDDTEARALIHSGALDTFSGRSHRQGLLWEFALWRNAHAKASQERDLFACRKDRLPDPALPVPDEKDRLRKEFSVLGFLCDRHPMALYSEALQRLGPVKASAINRFIGKRVKFAGWLITGKRVQTRHGDSMEFLTFEDETGMVETTFFPGTYRRFCHMVTRNRPYLLQGKVESDWGAVMLTVDGVRSL
jgi:DNA polymerase-3 subunit alpha/error-prone DNA polymerase